MHVCYSFVTCNTLFTPLYTTNGLKHEYLDSPSLIFATLDHNLSTLKLMSQAQGEYRPLICHVSLLELKSSWGVILEF